MPARDLGSVYRDLVRDLAASGVATPELDARLLICHACAITHERFAAAPEREVSHEELERISLSAKRRRAREPVSRILGCREFWGLDFEIGPQTLDPRPDTETLVSAALELVRERGNAEPLSVLDLGTGSGCILISLLHELAFATGVGTDTSIQALELARANALRHGVARRAQFLCTSWQEGLGRSFDMVVANPPYIPTGDLAGLEPEVALFDPRAALDGGRDGLDAYRNIIPSLHSILAPGGWAVFEIGEGQGEDVSAMFRVTGGDSSFDEVRQWHDIAGRVRCVAGKRSPTS
jgi:release factor glutamine methyltransferase